MNFIFFGAKKNQYRDLEVLVSKHFPVHLYNFVQIRTESENMFSFREGKIEKVFLFKHINCFRRTGVYVSFILCFFFFLIFNNYALYSNLQQFDDSLADLSAIF